MQTEPDPSAGAGHDRGSETPRSKSERVEISKRVVLINSASALSYRLLTLSVLVWLQQYLLKRVSAEEYALYPAVAALLAFSPVVLELLAGGITRFVTEAYARGDDERIGEIVSSLAPFLLGMASLLIGLFGLLVWQIDVVLNVEPQLVWDARVMLMLMGFYIAWQLAIVAYMSGFHVRQKFMLQNITQLGEQILSMGLLFGLLFGVSTRVLWVVVASVSAGFVVSFVRLRISRRLVPALAFRRDLVRRRAIREIVGFGAWTSLGTFANMIRLGGPPLVLNHFGTAVQLAEFHVGSLVVRNLHQLMLFVTAPLQPVLVTMHATGRQDRMGAVFLRGGRLALWMTLLPATSLAVFSSEVIELYLGGRYDATARVLVILFGTFPFVQASAFAYRLAVATAQLKRFFVWVLASELISLTGMLIAVAVLDRGAEGVAIAVLGSSILSHVVAFWPMGLTMAGVSFGDFVRRTLRPGLIPCVVAGGAGLLLRSAYAPHTWLALGLCAAAVSGVYAAVLLLCLEREDRQDLGRLIARRAVAAER